MRESSDHLEIGNIARNSFGKVGVIETRIQLCSMNRGCGYFYQGHELGDKSRYWEGVEVEFVGYGCDDHE